MMHIFVIQVDSQTYQDSDIFERKEEKQEAFAKKHNTIQENRNYKKSTLCFFSTIAGLGGAAGLLPSGLARMASFVWACLSADATYTSVSALYDKPSTTKSVLVTRNPFASSSVLGAFPATLIDNMINHTKYSIGDSIERMLKGNPGLPIPCCHRPISFFMSGLSLESQLTTSDLYLPDDSKFKLNPNRRKHAKQPYILYLVSNDDPDTVFSTGDYAIDPDRKKLNLYTTLADAIDAYKSSQTESISRTRLAR